MTTEFKSTTMHLLGSNLRSLDQIVEYERENKYAIDIRTIESSEKYNNVDLCLHSGDVANLCGDCVIVPWSRLGCIGDVSNKGSIIKTAGWRSRIHNLLTFMKDKAVHVRPGYNARVSVMILYSPYVNHDLNKIESELQQLFIKIMRKADKYGMVNLIISLPKFNSDIISFDKSFEYVYRCVKQYIDTHLLSTIRRIVFSIMSITDYGKAQRLIHSNFNTITDKSFIGATGSSLRDLHDTSIVEESKNNDNSDDELEDIEDIKIVIDGSSTKVTTDETNGE
jgi:hypothetical protein